MAINEVNPSANRSFGNGSATVFPYTFEIASSSEIEVLVDSTVKQLTTDYTVSGVGNSGGGNVTFVTAPANGTTVTRLRKQPAQQLSIYTPREAFPASRIESDLDKCWMAIQQTRETLSRCVQVPKQDASITNAPALALRASRYAAWDSSGNPIALDATSASGTLVTATGTTTARYLADWFATPVNVKANGAIGVGTTDDWAACQASLNASYRVHFPTGTYLISAPLVVRPGSYITGEGPAEYVTSLTAPIKGTRIITTGAFPAFTTDIGSPGTAWPGAIQIEELTVLGGIVASPLGTYGIYSTSSNRLHLKNVWAKFFTQVGIYAVGSLLQRVENCEAMYCQDAGIVFDYGAYGGGGSTNSYMSYIRGGQCSQNRNAGIRLGVSTYGVHISNIDIESNGNYYPGDGYGIYLPSQAETVTISGCHLEGNKIPIVVGDNVSATPSLNTIPRNTIIENNQFWSIAGGGTTAIKLNVGKGTVIRDNLSQAPWDIVVGHFSDNPVLQGNSNFARVLDGNGNVCQYDTQARADTSPTSALLPINAVITQSEEISPAGNAAIVYKVTPSATGVVKIYTVAAVYAQLRARQTIGVWLKCGHATEQTFWWEIASVGIPRVYTYSGKDVFSVGTQWKWFPIGRSIDSADAGNQEVRFAFTAPDLTPFYFSGFAWMPGIETIPYTIPERGIVALTNTATPSVRRLRRGSSGGTTGITDFTNGAYGHEFTFFADHAVTITDGTNIFLNGSANFAMNASDTLTLVRRADGKWYETGRSDNT